jgi:hypothetical protein
MTDRPILFSAPMIRALLDGRKTQTRRLAWQEPRVFLKTGDGPAEPVLVPSLWQRVAPGDRLWVREAFSESDPAPVYRADYDGADTTGWGWRPSIHMPRRASRLTLVVAAARRERLRDISREDAIAEGFARLSKDGGRVWKYGLPDRDGLPGTDDFGWPWHDWELDPRDAFRKLWETLHGAGAWAINPELTPLTFTVERRNIDALGAPCHADVLLELANA